ncbi:hypothetical protein GCM10027059_02770 [Myceligenerans halotolerans]
MDYEADHLAAFLAGDEQPPTQVPSLAAWFDQIRDLTGRGRRFERVRIHQDPPTDYQRWVRWVGKWNEDTGEVMHYITPEQARAADLLPAVGPDDWWLLDDVRLLRMTYPTPGVATNYLVTDPAEIDKARTWWRLALRAAGQE